jgi:ketosteroid isomerase-like protein
MTCNKEKLMPHSRRSVLTAGATALASFTATAVQTRTHTSDTELAVTDLIGRSEKANAALMRGDIETYLGLITVSNDFTLMSPMGGKPSHGTYTREQWDRIGEFFKNGTLKQELVQAYGSAELVVLAIIEHCHGEVGGLPPQDWPLRVTLVYRRQGSDWLLVHRHADPLVKGISVEQSAALARGSEES